jgi:hypothetical protein
MQKRAMVSAPPVEPEEWWVAELAVPMQAAVVDFVLNYFEHWDNNGRQDYALKVCVGQA